MYITIISDSEASWTKDVLFSRTSLVYCLVVIVPYIYSAYRGIERYIYVSGNRGKEGRDVCRG